MAVYDCGQDYAPNIGTVHDEVTIGYPPDALSTGVCYHTNWRPINYTELAYPPPDYEVVTQAACSMSIGDTRTIDSSHILAGSPIFSIPGGISQVDPLWSTCTPAAPGGYDPPRALTRSQNLVPSPTPPPVSQAKPEPESSAALQLPVETGAPSTTTGGKSGQTPQDPSNPNANESPDPSVSASQGAAIAGDPGSNAGNQEGSPDSQQSPGAKGNVPDPQNPSTSTVPSVGGGGNAGNSPQGNTGDTPPAAPKGDLSGSNPQNAGASSTPSEEDGGTSGSTPQDNGGNVGSSAPDGPKAPSADTQASGIPNTPDSVGKGASGSVSPEVDNNGGSNIGASLQEASGGGVKIGTVTIAPGAQTTHSGHAVSVGSSFVLVDGTSFDLQSLQSGAPPGIAITTGPSQQDLSPGGVVVGTTTLAPGVQSIYSGQTISVGSSVFAIDVTSYSKASSAGGFIIGTTTLPPGAQITSSGHVISGASDSVVIDGSSYAFATAGTSQQDLSPGGLVVGTTTLAPGVQSTFSGHTISVGSSVFALDGTSYSKASGGGLIIGTTTLPPGTQITASGHVISVASNSVVIDGSAYAWAAAGASSPTATTPVGGNLGGLILSAFGSGTIANSTGSPVAFAGGAGRLGLPLERGLLVPMMVMYIMCLYIR